MFECLHHPVEVVYVPPGPGSPTLQFGDSTLGYYGEVTAAELFTTAELSTAIGYSGGNVTTAAPGWIKMMVDGKTLFFPKKALKTGVMWNDLYNAGAVYGINGIGNYPVGAGVLQTKTVQKDAYTYKVRLGSMANVDPATSPSPNTPISPSFLASEWGRIFNALSKPKNTGYTGVSWLLYDFSTIFSNWVLCRDTYAPDVAIAMAINSGSLDNPTSFISKTDKSYGSWFPILELVPS